MSGNQGAFYDKLCAPLGLFTNIPLEQTKKNSSLATTTCSSSPSLRPPLHRPLCLFSFSCPSLILFFSLLLHSDLSSPFFPTSFRSFLHKTRKSLTKDCLLSRLRLPSPSLFFGIIPRPSFSDGLLLHLHLSLPSRAIFSSTRLFLCFRNCSHPTDEEWLENEVEKVKKVQEKNDGESAVIELCSRFGPI